MGTRQRKLERRRVQRKKKQREKHVVSLRRELQPRGDAHPVHACMANRNWADLGKASILFARQTGPSSVTLAAFLVDTWAMGLKDAWGRTEISRSEFDEYVSRYRETLETCPLDVGLARHLVYGGIQLSRELGFKLPPKYRRWTAVLGPLPEGESPDMELFRDEGKIRVVCSQRDFEARLIGTTPEKFLNRPDVEYMLGDDDFSLLDDDDEDNPVDEAVGHLEQAMLQRISQWCFANGQQPHPLLPDVIDAVLLSTVQGLPDDLDPEAPVESLSEGGEEAMSQQMERFLSASFRDDPSGYDKAMEQLMSFIASTGSPEEFCQGLEIAHEASRNGEMQMGNEDP